MEQQRSLETIGMLSSGIAHDFNNLLVTIIGNADLALRKLDADSAAYSHLRHIKSASVRASELTGQLLAYAGNGTVTRGPVDLNAVVEDMAALFGAAMPPSITVTFRFAEESPVVLANESQIRQVVMNLMTNAIDAIGGGDGDIILTTGLAGRLPDDFANQPGDCGYAFLDVADTGCGISPDIAPRMFEPFVTSKPTGRGLGLAIVNEHVAGNNGVIAAGNREDDCVGARFTVWLPLTDRPLAPVCGETPADDMRLSGTVLIIDDEADVRETTAAMLTEAGFIVLTATTGNEGLSLFDRDPAGIDLVLVDLTLPTRDGLSVARDLKARRSDVPIVLSSGYGCPGRTGDGAGEPFDAFMRKPYQLSVLLGTIGGVLTGKVRTDV